jgi:hypothetical protein
VLNVPSERPNVNAPLTPVGRDDGSTVARPASKKPKKVEPESPPSCDGKSAKEWEKALVDACYHGVGLPEWRIQVKAIQFMRERFPVEVVIKFYQERKLRESRTIEPRWIARDIVNWPGLERAMQQWRDDHGGLDTAVGDRQGDGAEVQGAQGADTDAARWERVREQRAQLAARLPGASLAAMQRVQRSAIPAAGD